MSLIDDPSRDRNLEAARLNLRMKDGEIKLTVSIRYLSVCIHLIPLMPFISASHPQTVHRPSDVYGTLNGQSFLETISSSLYAWSVTLRVHISTFTHSCMSKYRSSQTLPSTHCREFLFHRPLFYSCLFSPHLMTVVTFPDSSRSYYGQVKTKQCTISR